MNFSDEWRSLWPVSSVFPAPNLLLRGDPSNTTLGPLLFLPDPHSLRPLLLFRSAPPPAPSPRSLLHGVRSFFRSEASAAFLPNSSLLRLSSQAQEDPFFDVADDPLSNNSLVSLRLRDGSFLLLFPAGENSDKISFLTMSFSGGVGTVGEVRTQEDGFMHPSHRILRMLAALVPGRDWDETEGFLVAATMYSASWFRIERRVADGRVFLVPVAKQGFDCPVVGVCCSPHFPEESALLLKSGEVFWFHLGTKRSRKVRVGVGGGDREGWLRCEFGGQPWILLVACSSEVVVVDLRGEKGAGTKVLARVGGEDGVFAFCRSRFNDFHVSVVTEDQVLLFDVRQPLVPILTWNHRICCPCYVSMFRLSELRLSDEFRWASDSGFVIMAGSFRNDEFSVFCYGPKERGNSGDSLLYAWELPSCLSLSGRYYDSIDSMVKEDHLNGLLRRQQQKDVVIGFWIVPSNVLKVPSKYGGFDLIRLMSSGKLEMQSYHASWDKLVEKSSGEVQDMLEVKDSVKCCNDQYSSTSTRYYYCKFGHIYEYMNGNLPNALALHEPHLRYKATRQSSYNHNLKENISNSMKTSCYPVSAFINDVTVPMNIFEIALRKVLNSLEPDILPLAFSKPSVLFENNIEKATLSLLEVPSCLPHHTMTHYLMRIPSRTGKRSRSSPFGESLVGPVLPVPVLLTLQHIQQKKKTAASLEEAGDDLLALECKRVLDSSSFSAWGSSQDLQYDKIFMYEPSHIGNRYTCKGNRLVKSAVKEEVSQMDQSQSEPEPDKIFTTFIGGTAEKTCHTDNRPAGFEMFDCLSPLRLDFDSPSIAFQPREEEKFKRFTRQASKWQKSFKPYEDFMQSVGDSKVASLK